MGIPNNRVFLNVPYDDKYEALFTTLVGVLVFLGQTPHCVLEVSEVGQGRLQRIFDLMKDCRMSIHDLCFVSTPVRFNMPFELGLACAFAMSNDHEVVVLDSIPFRVDKTLSDYKGRDPLIHGKSVDRLVLCLLDLFSGAVPDPREIRSAARLLRKTVPELKKQYRSRTVFRPSMFRALVAAALEIAAAKKFIAQ